CNVVNFRSLRDVDYSQRVMEKQSMLDAGYPYGAEFVIIVPDVEEFIDAAEVIKDLRQEEGIITEIFTLSEIGSTFEEIEYWIDYAYYSWTIPPEAILLLADCDDENFTEGIPSKKFSINDHGFRTYASDNYYADIDGDYLPDIAVGRIPARNEDNLDNIIGKLLQMELYPITNGIFYENVLVSGSFQYAIDHHVISEITRGFYENELNKSVTRLYVDYPLDTVIPDTLCGYPWILGGLNGYMPGMINYFSSLGYITDSITEDFLISSIWNKNSSHIKTAIENGCFIVYNHGHGGVGGGSIPAPSHWSQPWYNASDLNNLNNYGGKTPYVYALGCWVGKFDDTLIDGCRHHSEQFMFLSPNATGEGRGAIGVTSASYKWSDAGSHFLGFLDFMYPNFDPEYPSYEYEDDTVHQALPGFALVSGKIYMSTRDDNWQCFGNAIKLFHHFGDPYLSLYTEVPSNMLVFTSSYINSGDNICYVNCPYGSMISLIANSEIIGRGKGIGSNKPIQIIPQPAGTEIELVVTKQNCYRYYDTVDVYSTEGVFLRFTEIDTILTFHDNGQINPLKQGMKDTLILEIINFGENNSSNTDFILQSYSQYIDIYNETLSVAVATGDTEYLEYEFSIINNPVDNKKINLELSYDDGTENNHTDTFSFTSNCPVPEHSSIFWFPPRPGDTSYTHFNLKNIGSGSIYNGYYIFRTEDTSTIIIDSIFDMEIEELVPGQLEGFPSAFYFMMTPEKLESEIIIEANLISDSAYISKDTFYLHGIETRYFWDSLELSSPYTWTYTGDESWHITEIESHSGNQSMYNGLEDQNPPVYANNITNSRAISDSFIIDSEINEIIVYLSYWHKYELEYANDGVQVQAKFTTDSIWTTLIPISGYPCEARGYGGFEEGEELYSGDQEVWCKQYTVIDSTFFNQYIQLCFRFGSSPSSAHEGYYFDDVKVYTLYKDNEQKESWTEEIIQNPVYNFSVRNIGSNITTSGILFEYTLPEQSKVNFAIYDITGRKIKELFNGFQNPGIYRLYWDGRNDDMQNVSSSMYFYRINAGDNNFTEKFMILR
ncbi:MAG: C25 family cysteine peptidase, partial [bacterium]